MVTSTSFSPFVKQCFVTAAVCSNTIGHACSVGFPAVLLPQLHLPGSIITLTKAHDSWIASVMAISMLVGNFLTSTVSARLGRRAAHLAVSAPALLGWLTTVLATTFQALLIGRILLGLSFGLSLPLRSVLLGEYTSPKNRGAFLSTLSLAQGFGMFLVHLTGSLISWQKTALICVFFPFISFVMTLYCPESPSYLAATGDYNECRKAFVWLRGEDENAELEAMIQARQIYDKEKKSNDWKGTLATIRKKEFYKPIVLMVHIQAMLQFSGGPIMAAYSTVVIGLALGSGADAHFWMIFLDTQRIISNFIAVYLIKTFKRRTMMFSTGSLCIISQIAIAVYVYTKNNGVFNYNGLWLPVILINLQFFSIATGMIPLPTVMSGEVFPLQYRSIGSSITFVLGAVCTFTVLKTFPSLIDSVGLPGAYLLYAGFVSYFLLVTFFLLPETKGRTLQEIEEEFRGRSRKSEEPEAQALQAAADARKMSIISAHSVVMDS